MTAETEVTAAPTLTHQTAVGYGCLAAAAAKQAPACCALQLYPEPFTQSPQLRAASATAFPV